MSRLPQPGDAVKTSDVLNKRMGAVVGVEKPGDWATTGGVTVTPTSISGPGLVQLRALYGDLLLVEETLGDAGWLELCLQNIEAVRDGDDPLSTLTAVVLQAVAFGALMERLRWERDR